jgi:hypothetical protein
MQGIIYLQVIVTMQLLLEVITGLFFHANKFNFVIHVLIFLPGHA